eukprot:31162-Pelagococcus_subviridis.AAC.3
MPPPRVRELVRHDVFHLRQRDVRVRARARRERAPPVDLPRPRAPAPRRRAQQRQRDHREGVRGGDQPPRVLVLVQDDDRHRGRGPPRDALEPADVPPLAGPDAERAGLPERHDVVLRVEVRGAKRRRGGVQGRVRWSRKASRCVGIETVG